MANLIRPQAREALHRWRGSLIAGAVMLLGIYWAVASIGLLKWLGWVLVVLGASLLWTALQRARFRAEGDGPGVVQVIEGEIRYFGPRGGGFAARDTMVSLSLGAGGDHWLIESLGGDVLVIPRAASGAELLFDVFASLPGLEVEALLRSLAQDPAPRAQNIWRRNLAALLT